MKKTLLIIAFFCFCFQAFSQENLDQQSAAIIKEGKLLYRSEMASWYGTDVFMEKFKEKSANIGGYLSYAEGAQYKCVFFSKGEEPKVIATIKFDSTYNVQQALADGSERVFDKNEADLYSIRKAALHEVNTDTIFKVAKNINLNLVPLIIDGQRKVYILSGPRENGFVILGNDYLITFDKDNKIIEKRKIHRNMIPIAYGKKDEPPITAHSHLAQTGELITATDICTLMLYGKFANWKQHYVLTPKYVCIWDFGKNDLITITREAWDRINKDQKERHKN
ncbi:hypothetical protein [Pedobacter rhizosphaerae]|uniref:Uncharacterized protein n=1 Tax=Pedobacter rhizosphaerae TaxID=390241 RepID=A0A1H9NBL8_9SPHI|nr:hypothetical protein [Pedobacter rhizosphaerae]SER33332.1 hypothetical protein SAMN04488023_107149 [Pedobacter rhizosphaerae]